MYRHSATNTTIGPIRAAVLLGILQTPHRFRTKRPLWSYSGLGIEGAEDRQPNESGSQN